jgi:hypothetical protein
MPDRLCPFCGKSNPESAELCANCQARLISPEKGEVASPPPSEDNLRNWLSQTGAAAADAVASDIPSQSEEPPIPQQEVEAPDWLMRIRERSKAEQESIEKTPQEPSMELPKNGEPTQSVNPPSSDDWLSKLRTSQPAAPLPEIPDDESKSTQVGAGAMEESSEWLKKLEDWKQTSKAKTPTEPEQPLAPTVKPFPKSDLKKLDASKPIETPAGPGPSIASPVVPSSEKPGSAPGERIPEWLQELESSFPPPEPDKKKESTKPEKKKGTGRLFKTKTGSLEESKSGSSGQIPVPNGEMPHWLSNMTTPTPPTPGVKPVFDQEESKEKPAAPFSGPIEAISPEEAGKGELAPAQLPGWLQALRPVESILPENLPFIGKTSEQGTGPLEGISDVLPGAEVSSPATKPPVYAATLKIDDRQKLHAQLLDSVVKEGDRLPVLRTQEKRKIQKISSIIVSMFILVCLFFPFIINSSASLTPAPVLFSPETVALFDGIKSLPEGSPVLVILDYQPGFSAELQPSSLGVIEHLMTRNARLAFISSTPTGAVLVDELVQSASKVVYTYSIDESVINLGYLPGGAIGLQQLALEPRFTLVKTWQNTDPWNGTPLQSIKSLNDFSGILLITESPENGRLWIEQVLPSLGSMPAWLITSAQSAPVLLPYYRSAQLQGVLGGLAGGMMYERLLGQPGPSTTLWDSYQIGIVGAFLTILVGGIIQSVITRRKGS